MSILNARNVVAAMAGIALAVPSFASIAQTRTTLVDDVPTVAVSASATTQVRNDRVHAWMRAEAEAPDAAAAARQVNAAMARALARIRSVPSLTSATSAYSTQPLMEKGRTVRWRISQTLTLETSDFEALAELVGHLQANDGLLLGGLAFSVSREARESAERDLVRRAVHTWQARAGEAATALGFASFRPWHVNVQASEGPRPYPMMRAAAAPTAADARPIAVEAGFSEVSVTVTGEAQLDTAQVPAR